MLPITKLKNRKEFSVEIDKMVGGLNTLFSDVRLGKDECSQSTNLMLVEDGVLDKRWGTAAYTSATYTNRPDGFEEYRKTDGTRELIVIADGKGYQVDEDGTKNEISGATFTQGTRAYFLQYNNFLYVANGTDSLARYNGSSFVTYAGIDTPTWDATPLTLGAGLSTGNFNAYYRITALNEVGETTPADEKTITHDIERDAWDGATEIITLEWDNVSGATNYQIYYSDVSGFEVLLAETTDSTYVDDGTAVPNPFIETPDADTTVGPKFTHMSVIENRIWATGDPSNQYRVFFSGTGVNKGNFSDAYGGGWVDLEKGGKNLTVGVADFQGVAHVWTKTDDGRGGIWQVKIELTTVATETFPVPVPKRIIHSIGTESAKAIVYVENDMFFLNKKGVYVLGNEPGILNVLRTNELSAKVRPYIQGLDDASFDKACAYYTDAKVFFSVSSANGEPDQMIIFDRERGAWVGHWTIGVSQFGEFTDSSGVTRFLGIVSDKLVEISSSYENDQGTAFTWTYESPRLPISKDWSEFGRVRRAYVKLRNATGTISAQVFGTGKNGQFTSIGSATINPGNSTSGFGWNQFGAVQFGNTDGTATAFAIEDLISYLKLQNKSNLLRDVQWKIQGDNTGDKAVILGLLIKGTESSIKVPLSAKL